ncbi:MAG: aminoglycoside phosphotransferase family protein [Anaerolineales bacterium]|nr:aminoglycoside phosphotransferase family protein [Anaerolineales bacterium]
MTAETSISSTLDPAMPALDHAMDPAVAGPALKRALGESKSRWAGAVLNRVRLLRHKPGRRALVEYELSMDGLSGAETLTLLGKIRAKGLDRKTPALMGELARNGFAADSADGVSIPEVMGEIPELQMWLQRKVPGVPLTNWLAGADGFNIARRVAEAAHKIHRANVPATRRHTVDDELRILQERLELLMRQRPEWRARLESVLARCRIQCDPLRTRPTCGVHRDFYPAQILADGGRLWILDFDLYCESDPALDVGNFLGHITEQSLRETGTPDALKQVEETLLEHYLSQARSFSHYAVATYHTLTLVRHISISTQFPERQHTTELLLELCEARLG